jgi:glycosyltransferase involved in cell wall biosynthesis
MSIETPLVSVLCTAYNAEQYIKQAMESILDQSYPNLQLVISDDYSQDSTVDIAKQVAKLYPDRDVIISVNEVNLGITSNCNVGLRLCDGDFICCFACDDLMYTGKIEKQIEVMQSNAGSSICYHGVDIVDDAGDIQGMIVDDGHKYKSAFDIVQYAGLPYTGAMMIRRSAIPEHGYDERLPSVSDWLFLVECAVHGPVLKLENRFSAYRKHNTGVSKKTFELLAETLETLDIIEQKLPSLTSACKIGRRRYLLGEVARCVLSMDLERVKDIRHRIELKPDMWVKLASVFGTILISLNIPRTKIFRKVYNRASASVKL